MIICLISHKTKGCDIWPPLKSQLGKRFLTWSIVLYSFELLNISIVFTNITWKQKSEQNATNYQILRVLHVQTLYGYCTRIFRLITNFF